MAILPDGYAFITRMEHGDDGRLAVCFDPKEIVMCKHCKWFRILENDEYMCAAYADWMGIELPTNPDDYCNYGKRNEGGAD